jgi:hypothetical protein
MAHPGGLEAHLASIVADFAGHADQQLMRQQLQAMADQASTPELVAAAEPYRDDPEVISVLYERVVEQEPGNARALVILANAWWLQGRGPESVGTLANRALAADPTNRGAWHLWALSEPDPRSRVQRWQQVSERFPQDDLALAAVADNAAAVAGAEHDYPMLDLSIATFERLLERATEPAQKTAVDEALRVLRGWRF